MSNDNLLLYCDKCGGEIEAKRELLDLSDYEDESGNHRWVGYIQCPYCYEMNDLDFSDYEI